MGEGKGKVVPCNVRDALTPLKVVQWYTKVKYLCLYLISGADFKIDVTAAKGKYYRCFNTIMSVVGNQVNEIMALHLVNSYCPPQLIMHAYRCEIWPLNSGNIHEIDIIWNNGFRRIFNCCWPGLLTILFKSIVDIRYRYRF